MIPALRNCLSPTELIRIPYSAACNLQEIPLCQITMSSGTTFPDPGLDQGSNTYVGVTIVTASFTFISTITVALRLAYRAFTASLKWDDWVCLSALLFAYALLVTTILISTVGQAGHHIYEYDRHDLQKHIKVRYILPNL